MPKRNSSNGSGDALELTRPGKRSGEGSESVLPYLHESLATKPGELLPTDPFTERKPRRSLVGRVRRALRQLKK